MVRTNLVALALLVGVYLAVLLRQLGDRGPPVWGIFLGGGFLTVVLGVLPIGSAEATVVSEAPVFLFLFALFVFVADLERAGALEHIARWLIHRAPHVEDLPFVLFLGFGLLATFLLNDALVLLGVPLLLAMARRLDLTAKPLVLTMAFAVTVGSALTPLGNPQNLLVSLSSGISAPVATFLRYLFLPTVVNLVLGGWYVRRAFRGQIRHRHAEYRALQTDAPSLFPRDGWLRRILAHPSLVVFPVSMVAIVTTDVVSVLVGGPPVPLYLIALGGAVVVLLAGPDRGPVLARVDWTILLLFAGLFVVVGGALSGGVIDSLRSTLPIPPPGHPIPALGAVAGSSLIGAQLVSNVPWVALQISLLHGIGYTGADAVVWVALAATSTLAGNLTLLGAASNLIVVERARREGLVIRLGEFVRVGAPLTAITVLIVVAFLALGL